MEEALLAELGVKTQAAEHLEQSIIGQALVTETPGASSVTADGSNPQGLAEQLFNIQQESATLAQAISAQQQHAAEAAWASDEDEAAKEVERGNRQLEAAVMQQRLDALQQQQQHLQQQLNTLPADQKHLALLHYQEHQEAAQRQQQQKGRRNGHQKTAGTSSSRGAASGRGRRRAAAAASPAAQAAAGMGLGMESAAEAAAAAAVAAAPKLLETERDRLIRLGVLTPFDKLDGFDMKVHAAAAPAQQLQDVRLQGVSTCTTGQHHWQHQHQQHKTSLEPRQLDLVATVAEPLQLGALPDVTPQQPAAVGPSPAAPGKVTQLPPPAAPPVDEQWALLQQRSTQAGPAGAAVDVSSIPDLAHQVGRSGLPLAELITKAAQQAVEVGINQRPRAVLMEPHQVPRQERELIKVNPLLWRAGAASQSRVVSKRPPRRSTLPRQKRKRHAVALTGAAAAEQQDEQDDSRHKRQRQQQDVMGSEDDRDDDESDNQGSDEGGNGGEDEEYLPTSDNDAAAADGQTDAAAGADSDDLVDEGVEVRGVEQQHSRNARRRGRLRQGSSSARSSGVARGSAGQNGSTGAGNRQREGSSDEDDVDEVLQQQQEQAVERDELADYDDVDGAVYEARLERYQEQLELKRQQRQQQQQPQGQQNAEGNGPAAAAVAVDGDSDGDVLFDGGFMVPGGIWAQLFDYQRTGVKWLWELHNQRAGGIIGDEMGLGKTIQVIAYLAGLHHSGLWKPSLVVAPATVLRQWMNELRIWYPPLRVLLLHESGKSPYGVQRPDKAGVLDLALSAADCSLVLTTYDQLRLQRDMLLPVRWGVVVLDEGHKIRNPDAEVTLAAKQLQTVHRIIMSGSPIQNRLSELWSLFDFIFPGKLGTLPVFTAQFAIPITIGGYTNASKLQVQTAYRCAVVLRDLINPYLLRRRKADVATQLPKKTETVLFCTLTEQQRDLYRAYINSKDVSEILAGQRQALAGIDVLRKICNHPDLLQRTMTQGNQDYGNPDRSGKLQVLSRVLTAWHAEGHKVLLFTQTQQMLDIIEKHVVSQGYSYHRMDGGTAIAQRGRLMDDFNTNPNRFLFLLTTKVGGLGVNLTGANRVVIYDPDWNPSTDTQARERAWRIGQGRPVTIYRLITSGTIEEKVYHRQIYKSYLTNKVLQDPRQRRFFASRDISDLFTLADEHGGTVKRLTGPGGAAAATAAEAMAATETEKIFSGVVGQQRPPSAVAAGSWSAPVGGTGGQQQQQQEGEEVLQEDSKQHNQQYAAAGPADNRGALRGRAQSRRQSAVAAERAKSRGDGSGGDEAAEDDARVLRDLFEGTGVKSLIDHTSIESAHDSEAIKADEHAARVAVRAAEVLRQSRLACQTAAVNVPTWTGRHGSAGAGVVPSGGRVRGGTAAGSSRSSPAAAGGGGRSRFGSVRNPLLTPGPLVRTASPAAAAGSSSPADGTSDGNDSAGEAAGAGAGGAGSGDNGRFGSRRGLFSGRQAGTTGGVAPSSAALLARMRERQQAAAEPGASREPQSGDGRDSTAVQLAGQIVSFIQGAGGAANSELLLSHFKDVLKDADMPLFKQLLRQVARLQVLTADGSAGSGRGGGHKVWVLKAGYAAGVE